MLRLITVVSLLVIAPALSPSGAEAQVPSPGLGGLRPPSAPEGKHGTGDACRSASRIGALDSHERIAILCLDSLELGPIHDLTDLLSSRIPGVLVQETSGVTGTAARIRIRGQGSILLDNDPLLIVDGVRALGAAPVATSVLGPQVPSRLDDFNINDIAVIEVLRGPATTAMYGTGAANGVIRITTKRGGIHVPRWTAVAEAGPVLEPTRYPANYEQSGIHTTSGTAVSFCTLDARARRFCEVDATALASFNPLEQASQFRRGLRQSFGAGVSGGTRLLGYHAAAGHSSEEGVLDGSDLARNTLRLNLDLRPLRGVSVALTSAYLSSDARFPKSDFVEGTVLRGGLLGRANGSPPYLGYFQPPESLNVDDTRQEARRLDAGLAVEWRTPLSWLTLAAGLGVDRTDTDGLERVPDRSDPSRETRTDATLRLYKETMGAAATASWSSGGGLRSITRLGVDRDETDLADSSHVAFPNGLSLSPGRSMHLVTTGLYATQRLAWRDRVAVSAGLRRDEFRSSTGDSPRPMSRSAGLLWLVRREPLPASRSIGAVRLHLAYGEVPGPTTSRNLEDMIMPSFGGNGGLDLERTVEIEGGLTSSFVQDRVRLSLTGYRKTTKDAFIPGSSSGGYGFPTFSNGAEVQNTGIEGTLGATVLDHPRGKLSVELGMWRNSNELLRLDREMYPYRHDFSQLNVEGRPLGGFWARRILSYDDLNGDGMISRVNCPGQVQVDGGPACEIQAGSDFEFLGSASPRFEAFLAPKLSLLDRVDISALLDYRSGFKQFNYTEVLRCMYSRCRAVFDPGAPLGDQARALGVLGGNFRLDAFGDYVEDATFVKLRELAVSVSVPESLTRAVAGRAARFTLAGRNLATWTGYSGLDPEISGAGPLGFEQAEAFTQPPLRYYTVRLTIGL